MSQEQEPNWQPITALPMLAHVVDGMLDSAEDNYRSLREARGRPHVLDHATALIAP